MHHDLGALGAAVNRRATERQLQIMKSHGRQRHPHQPQSAVAGAARILRPAGPAGDGRGVRHVETRPRSATDYGKYFDEWGETRPARHDPPRPQPPQRRSCGASATRSPSRVSRRAAELAKRLTGDLPRGRSARARPPRASTSIRTGDQERLAAQVDIVGLQLQAALTTSKILKEHPDWILVGAETASTVSSRGVYHLPIEKYQRHDSLQLTSYDVIAPAWAYLARRRVRGAGEVPATCSASSSGPASTTSASRRLTGGAGRPRRRLARAQFLLRHRGPGRLPEGPLLPLPERLDQRRRWSTCCRTGTGRAGKARPSR